MSRLDKAVELMLDNFESNSNFDRDHEHNSMIGLKTQIADMFIMYAMDVLHDSEVNRECWEYKSYFDREMSKE